MQKQLIKNKVDWAAWLEKVLNAEDNAYYEEGENPKYYPCVVVSKLEMGDYNKLKCEFVYFEDFIREKVVKSVSHSDVTDAVQAETIGSLIVDSINQQSVTLADLENFEAVYIQVRQLNRVAIRNICQIFESGRAEKDTRKIVVEREGFVYSIWDKEGGVYWEKSEITFK